jgi:hypothetical protein
VDIGPRFGGAMRGSGDWSQFFNKINALEVPQVRTL